MYAGFGKPICECKNRYEGDGITCTVINRCQSNNGGCDKNARCTETENPYEQVTCTCKPGFLRIKNSDRCRVDRCSVNNGNCHELATCEERAFERDPVRCSCKFPLKKVGNVCKEPEVNPCDNGTHGCDYKCSRGWELNYYCYCPAGQQLKADRKTCEDIDPCTINRGGCSYNATCTNNNGFAKCECKEEFEGDGKTCTKINECLTGNGGCSENAECKWNGIARTCICKPDFSGNGITCSKIFDSRFGGF